MKTRAEIAEILDCVPSQVTRYFQQGRLTISTAKRFDKRKKFFTDESVEKLRFEISENKKRITRISEKKIQKEKIKKKEILKKTENFILDDVGKQVMADTIDELTELGLYRQNDSYAILDYAMFYQIALGQTTLMADRPVYVDKKGVERISAHASLSLSFSRILDDKRKRLGLDPAARSKLTIKGEKDLSDMGELFGT